MRKTAMVMLGAAPSVALGYFILTGYILNKVRPLPITQIPRPGAAVGINDTLDAGKPSRHVSALRPAASARL